MGAAVRVLLAQLPPTRSSPGRIELRPLNYEAIHIDRTQYVILPNHPRADGEEIVDDNDRYVVVEKAVS